MKSDADNLGLLVPLPLRRSAADLTEIFLTAIETTATVAVKPTSHGGARPGRSEGIMLNSLPMASFLAGEAMRRQFAFDTPPEPLRPVRNFRPITAVQNATARLLDRMAQPVAPTPECGPAH